MKFALKALITGSLMMSTLLVSNLSTTISQAATSENSNQISETPTIFDSFDNIPVNLIDGIEHVGIKGQSYNALLIRGSAVSLTVASPACYVYKKNSSGEFVKTGQILEMGSSWACINRGNWWQVGYNMYVKMGTMD